MKLPLIIIALTLAIAAMLACGTAAPSDPIEPGGLSIMPQESTPEPNENATPGLSPEPTPLVVPTLTFRDHCRAIGYLVFRDGTADLEDDVWCYSQQLRFYEEWLPNVPGNPQLADVQTAYALVQSAVNRRPEITTAHSKVVACLGQKGHANVNPALLFPWQNFVSADDYRASLEALTAQERETRRTLMAPTDECAASGETNYYHLQGVAWREEFKQLKSDDAAQVRPLELAFINDVIERWGPDPYLLPIPHFLTIDGGLVFEIMGSYANPTPQPTPFPTPWPVPASRREPPQHPGGITGCRGLSIFTLTSVSDAQYVDWCFEEAKKLVETQCNTGTAEERKTCADTQLLEWREYYVRAVFRCVSIEDSREAQECSHQGIALVAATRAAIAPAWTGIYGTVSNHESVQDARTKVLECLADANFPNPPATVLFDWQRYRRVFAEPGVRETWRDGLTESEQSLLVRIRQPTDQCARKHGFYTAQETQLIAEIERLKTAEPATVKPLLDWHLLAILQEDGIAPFLTGISYLQQS